MAGCEIYKAGVFDFPLSTGDFSVTGLGFEPQTVIFFGGNRPEEDTHVTGAIGPGIFLSLNSLDYTNPASILSFCIFINGSSNSTGYIGYGAIQSPTGCIRMCTDTNSPLSIDYRASTITFDADGFTINVTHTPSGSRPIHWFAWGSSPDTPVQTAMMRENINVLAQPFNAGFAGHTGLVLSTIVNSGSTFTEGALGGQAWMSFGHGSYPEGINDALQWSRTLIYDNVIYGTSLGNQGFCGTFLNFHNQHVISSVGPVFIEGTRWFKVDSLDHFDWDDQGGGQANTYHQGIWWNQESWGYELGALPPAPDVYAYGGGNPHFNDMGAVLFITLSGPGSGIPLRYGFGVLTEEYQGCVVFGDDGSFYQSSNRCLANVNSTTLATASGSFAPGVFELEGMDSTMSAANFAIGFGCPGGGWMPQMYRRWPY